MPPSFLCPYASACPYSTILPLWAEAVYANGARMSSPMLLILVEVPPPVTWLNYTSQVLQYFLEYHANWTIDEAGLSQANRKVLFSSLNPEPFITYVSVVVDGRTLDQIH